MRVFLAGASGVIGSRVAPLLVARGNVVAGRRTIELLDAPAGVVVVADSE